LRLSLEFIAEKIGDWKKKIFPLESENAERQLESFIKREKQSDRMFLSQRNVAIEEKDENSMMR
jgi:hypothetical protein